MSSSEWPRGTSEIAERIRSYDWSGTPLGPLAQWPQSLRTTIDNILSTPYPMIVAWGDDLSVLYNSAYLDILGAKHPHALGKSIHAVWPDAVFLPMVERVLKGEAISFVDQQYDVPSRKEQPLGWFTGSWIPLRDEQDRIRGFQATVLETTERVLAQRDLKRADRRHALLLRVSDATRLLRNPADIQAETCNIIADHFQADRCSYIEIDRARQQIVIERDYVRDGAPSLAGRHPIEPYLDQIERMKNGVVLAIDDTETFPAISEAERDAYRERGVRAYLAYPIAEGSQVNAVLSVSLGAPRQWTEDDLLELRDVAERARDSMWRAAATSALRQKEERLTLAMEAGRLAAWDWDIETGHVEWTEEHYRQTGYEVGEIQPGFDMWLAAVHPDDRARALEALDHSRDERQPFFLEYRIVYRDASVRWYEARGLFFYTQEGKPKRMIGVQHDVTETLQLQARQQALLGELQHRTRNLMGVVRSLSEQTLRGSTSLSEFAPRFRRRIAALSRANGYLSRLQGCDRVTIGQILKGELDAARDAGLDPQAVSVSGALDTPLRSSSVQSLALAVEELCNDAARHRAERPGEVSMAVTLRLVQDEGRPWLDLQWQERGIEVASDDPEARASLAKELVLRALPYQFGARTDYRAGEDSLACSILIPVSERPTDDIAAHI